MANRFRAANPTQAFAAKVRYLVGCLILIIVVLTFTLIAVVQKEEISNRNSPTQEPLANAQIPASTVDVLFTTQRIAEGDKFDSNTVIARLMNPDQVPREAFQSTAKALLFTKAAARNVEANVPITPDMITDPRIDEGKIVVPPGFVAATIVLDSRCLVEGWVEPGKRVNVNVTFTDDKGRKSILTVVRGVKILSSKGILTKNPPGAPPVANAPTTVTLQLTEEEAKDIELARANGELCMVLISDQTPLNVHPRTGESYRTWQDFYKNNQPADPIQPTELPKPDGVMYRIDPETGREVRWELRNGVWKQVR